MNDITELDLSMTIGQDMSLWEQLRSYTYCPESTFPPVVWNTINLHKKPTAGHSAVIQVLLAVS